MSRANAQKKARRDKRQARKVVWARLTKELDGEPVLTLAPRNVTDAFLGAGNTLDDDDYPADVAEVVGMAEFFEREITCRGWLFDSENSNERIASWVFPPSAAQSDDEVLEPVTRVWLTVYWDDLTDPNFFPYCVNVLFVGSGPKQLSRRPTLDEFFEQIEAIEAYRAGDPVPAFE